MAHRWRHYHQLADEARLLVIQGAYAKHFTNSELSLLAGRGYLTWEQSRAVWHRSEEHRPFVSDQPGTNWHAEIGKSRLLGRMLFDGLPPTRTRPPLVDSGPQWEALPGGDPFAAPPVPIPPSDTTPDPT